MHFSIPDTQEIQAEKGTTYSAFNIHINGVFHCSVRYRQLHNLHDQLKKLYGASVLPTFPPKKLLPLTLTQLDERRQQLERYIQTVSQDARINTTDIFNGFLLGAQQETQGQNTEDVSLDVYLMNGQKIAVSILSTLQSDSVLENVGEALRLPSEYVFYFSLFLIRKEDDGSVTIMRKLQDFESPYISLKASKGPHQIVLRKSYWDPAYDDELMTDRVALNLLYVQTVSDVELGWVVTTPEIQKQLAALQSRGSKKEYLQLARTLKYYGCLQFRPCYCDYPAEATPVVITAGNRELNFKLNFGKDIVKECSFRVTRMKCWRITTSISERNGDSGKNSLDPRLELSFEYLVTRDKLQWITIISEHAILMSVCLQSMVEELLMKKNGTKIKKSHDKQKKGNWSYMRRDGSNHQMNVSRSVSCDVISHNDAQNGDFSGSSTSIKRLSEKFSSMKVSPSCRSLVTTPKSLVENDAFDGIGDDDL